jgi:hypothetical protein
MMLWLAVSLAVPAMLVLLAIGRGREARPLGLVTGALAAGVVLGPLLAPFAVVAPLAPRIGASGITLASGWLESGFLEEFAKAAALWLLLAPHRLVSTGQSRAIGAILISLSFGAYENLLHLADAPDPAGLVLVRSLVSLPAHFGAGLAAAVILLARPKADPATAGLAFLAAWFSHGAYNQWALAWTRAVEGQAAPEQVPWPFLVMLVAAPVAASLTAAGWWRRLVPEARHGARAALPWSVATMVLAASALLLFDLHASAWTGRPAMQVLALPFAALPAALAVVTGALAHDGWRSRPALAEVGGEREGGEVAPQRRAGGGAHVLQPGAALHLHEPAHRPLELERPLAHGVELVRMAGSTHHQHPPALVERVDQGHEPAGLVAAGRRQDRDAGEEHDPEMLADREVIGGAERPGAQVREVEQGDRAVGAGDLQRAGADRDLGGRPGLPVGQGQEQPLDGFRRGRVQRAEPGVQVAQPLDPVVDRSVQRQHVHPGLQQLDERKEALPVEALPVEPLGQPVRGRDHRDAGVEQAGEQPAEDHRIGDVDHVELVEAE